MPDHTIPPKARTARQRARDEITAEILLAARKRLSREGPNQLALRAVARDVGMVSSAVYRYFGSRDELLTALLVVGYNELGAAVEAADRAIVDRADFGARWTTACRAIRRWSLDHPGDYALLYGSPVPGFVAPPDTIAPATRVILVLVAIVVGAFGAGAVPPISSATIPGGAGDVVAPAAEFIREAGLIHDAAPTEVVIRTLMAWTTLFGTISFELFGHLVGSLGDYSRYFDQVIARLAADLGFAAAP